MFKNLFLIIIFSCFTISSFSQNLIKGKVINENGKPLTYATVTLLNPIDSTLKYFGVTNDKGYYQIKNIKSDKYLMQFSFVSLETTYEEISIPSDLGEDLGEKVMKTIILDEVIITAEYVPIKFKQDTVEFNTKAFVTKPDAVVEDLLKKIPGVEVDESGNLKALGEDVTKVLVDGKEFFGSDIKVATKNLPAKAIEKIQVFDKKSEEAEFMGIDDGVRDRTINLLLNEKNKKGYFGNLEAGAGYDNLYKTSGRVYRFSKKSQIALLGMLNNINEFGYTKGGHGGFGQKINGLNTTGACGMNLSYNASEYNRYFISYLGRSTNTILEQNTLIENFVQSGSYFQNSEYDKDEQNTPHGINFGVRHNFNPQNNLTVDGNINISANDIISNILTNTSKNDTAINMLLNATNNSSKLRNADAKVVYIFKFNNEKTQLKTNIKSNYDNNISALNWANTSSFFNPINTETISQFQDENTEKFNISANPTLVQQIGKFWYLSANVRIGQAIENFDREQGNQLDNTVVDSLSIDFRTLNTFIQPALSLRKSTGTKRFNVSFGVGWNLLEIKTPTIQNEMKKYFHFLPALSYENSYQAGRRIKFRYSSSVNMPSVNQLLPVVNIINPLSLYQGNSNLIPEYKHNLYFSYSIFDQFSFTSLFVRMGSGYTKDKISISQTINEDYTQMLTPVNVPYYYNIYSNIYFSTPIRSLGMKLNIKSNESWNRGISIINSLDNISTNFTHSIKLSIENRQKEKWNLNVGGSVSLTNSKLSIDESLNNNFFNTTYFLQLGFTPSENWSFETDGNIVNYNSKTFGESFTIPLLNAGISYYFLKGNKASITIHGSDLLDKSKSITQRATANYLMQTESNILGRRVMLIFKLRFGK